MLPASLNSADVRSRAEAPLFELLRVGLPDEYTVLHGVRWYIPRAESDPADANSEADYLLLHPGRGLLLIEAKAGLLEYCPIKGQWKIFAESGRAGSWQKRGPLEQAQAHRYALQRALERAYQQRKVHLPRFSYGFAVAIPEARYDDAFDAFGLPRCLALDADALGDVRAWVEGAYDHFGGAAPLGIGDEMDRVVEVLTGGPSFSGTLRERMLLINQTIDALTRSQYEVLTYLRGHKRVAIAGCAGSGKTLLAIEQAIRLQRRGLRTLLLCHNPHLADFLRLMTQGTGVEAWDLASWVARACAVGGEPASGDWSHYFEPTTNELDEAFDRLLASEDHRYDAIIVDEGQDFRGTWWTIVEAALRDPSEGFLYAFHDDNQALLPDRSEYPITSAPFVLSKNCRNAGKVFDLVRRFHDQAPEPSLHLSGHGELDLRLFQADDGPAVVADVLNELLANLETARLVVLTTEYEPVSSGVLEGLVVSRRQPYNWEATVSAVFADVRRKQRVHKYRLEDLASLEQALLRAPMNEDGAVLATYATVVADIAQQARRTMFLLALFRLHPLHPRPCRWSRDGTTLRLLGMRSVDDLFAFFSDPKWVDGLAGPGPVRS